MPSALSIYIGSAVFGFLLYYLWAKFSASQKLASEISSKGLSEWGNFIYPRDKRLKYLKMISPVSRYSGCTAKEIEAMEAELGANICAAHREFLKYYGREKDGPLTGSDCFLHHVVDASEGVDELLEENGLCPHHPSKPICIFMHQGYMAAWYYAGDKSEDPFCFFFSESGGADNYKMHHRVSDVLSEQYMAMAAHYGNNPLAGDIVLKQGR